MLLWMSWLLICSDLSLVVLLLTLISERIRSEVNAEWGKNTNLNYYSDYDTFEI